MTSLGSLSTLRKLLTLLLGCLLAAGVLTACAPFEDELRQALNGGSEAASPVLSAQSTPSPDSPSPGGEQDLNEENEQIILVEELIIALLFVAVLVGIAAHRLRVPYTVGLVLMGLVLTFRSQIEVTIPPNLILALLVPPLIFEAAFHLNLNELRRNLGTILIFAVPGVLLTTLVVGFIVAWGTGLPLPLALVFGALVSATDPISVVALFRKMGVPKRLQLLLEGESLFNDGTAIVIFNLALLYALPSAAGFNWAFSLIDFLRVSGGGLAIGAILGTLISQMISRIDDYLIETTLTSVLAYGAYLIAEAAGVSGVLAVVMAGLINGNIGPRGMSPTTRVVLFNFWEYAAFLANSFIFLLIGLSIDLPQLFQNGRPILWAVGAVLVARAGVIYGLSWFGRRIPVKWMHVLNWGGLRGAISLALALSLPASLEARDSIQVMAFGVVLFTLLVQGFTMEPLVHHLRLIDRSAAQDEYERRHARAVSGRSGYEEVRRQYQLGLLSEHTWKTLAPILEEHNEGLAGAVREILSEHPDLEAEELDTARREALRAQRSSLYGLYKDRVISEEVYTQLASEVDAGLIEGLSGWPDLFSGLTSHHTSINRLTAAVIQELDIENAVNALTKLGMILTTLPSSGGFLRRRSAVLLIGLADGQEEVLIRALKVSCRQRVEYPAAPLEELVPGVTTTVPVTVCGATIFTLPVERFEVF